MPKNAPTSLERSRAERSPRWGRSLEWPAWGIRLRPVERGDASSVARALTDEIARGVGLGTAARMRQGTRQWAEEANDLAERGIAFRYLVHVGDRLSGVIEVRRDAVNGHVGYWLRKSARGRGIATSALYLLLPIAFEGLRLRAIEFT